MTKRIITVLFSSIMILTMALGGLFSTWAQEEEAPKASVVASQTDDAAVKPAASEEVLNGEEIPAPDDIDPLTGLPGLAPEAIGKRPVAVMINNHPKSYPQYNIGLADVVFEVVVEHKLTRLLALFPDYTRVPYLVSIRSYRYYFPAISEGFDAFYIHWGEDNTMMWYYDELNLDSYDGLSNTYLFGRDQERIDNGYDLEHTSAFYGNLLPDQLAADGKRTDLDEEHQGEAFNFVPFGTWRVPGNESCTFADIVFGDQTAQFAYDEENGVYKKFANHEPHIDGISGEQLEFENVLILYTLIFDREDEPEADRKLLDVFGGLDYDYPVGYYISEGSVQKIRWGKDNEEERGRLRFYDEAGNEISINRGKTYVAFTYEDSAKLSDSIPEQYR